ncbi:MAG: flagellar protein FliS [Lachnospiraceae bacterium]|nr:flagellar protein FliS [Lachnospiraceae bacterium]
MTDEKKKEFTLKITQANRTRIVVLTYELALTYLEEARNAEGYEDFVRGIQHAKCCTDQLRSVLDYSQEIALYLYRIYNYISLLLDKAMIRHNAGILDEAEQLLRKLHDAFDRIADSDTSEPAMRNTETIYSGLTYGRAGAQENVSMGNRGFIA